jgi:predicted ribosome quality control (RQC) complex YloA/Tae2 family protein
VAELSGFEVLGLLKEIGESLKGAYVNNIYRAGGAHLLRLRKPDSDVWLVLSPKKGVWLSKKVSERTETTEFTTKLRAELDRARFLGASQADLDRVFVLQFENVERRSLVVELLPPGNIIVTDGGERIVVAQREVRTQARRVVKGTHFHPPAQTRVSPTGLSPDGVKLMLAKEKTAGGAIGRNIALPRKYVSDCLTRLGLDDTSPSSSLQGREADVVRTLASMVDEAREKPKPCVCETPLGDDIFVIPPKGLKVKRSAGTLSELCDELFLSEATAEPASAAPADAKRKEIEVTVARLREESASLRDEASKARAAAVKARSSHLKDAISIVKEAGLNVPQEPSSPDSAASMLFDHAKRLEAKSAVALESAARLERKAPKAGKERTTRTRPLPTRKQEWYEKFRWFFTSRGKLALGGRDAQTNSALIGRHLEDNDTVYHADLFGSPFFVLKGGADQSDEEVAEVAQATVAFSSAWKTGLGAADAYWVRPEQVRTSAPSGEYLRRGSFAITGRKNFAVKNIVEVAVALDPQGRVLAGPESAIRGQSARYLVLRPQKEKGSDTAKRVLKDLGAGGDAVPNLDDVLRALPTGGGKVIRRGSRQADDPDSR